MTETVEVRECENYCLWKKDCTNHNESARQL
jgi:hypothetical protein